MPIHSHTHTHTTHANLKWYFRSDTSHVCKYVCMLCTYMRVTPFVHMYIKPHIWLYVQKRVMSFDITGRDMSWFFLSGCVYAVYMLTLILCAPNVYCPCLMTSI